MIYYIMLTDRNEDGKKTFSIENIDTEQYNNILSSKKFFATFFLEWLPRSYCKQHKKHYYFKYHYNSFLLHQDLCGTGLGDYTNRLFWYLETTPQKGVFLLWQTNKSYDIITAQTLKDNEKFTEEEKNVILSIIEK